MGRRDLINDIEERGGLGMVSLRPLDIWNIPGSPQIRHLLGISNLAI
jgi:hypothetical protein